MSIIENTTEQRVRFAQRIAELEEKLAEAEARESTLIRERADDKATRLMLSEELAKAEAELERVIDRMDEENESAWESAEEASGPIKLAIYTTDDGHITSVVERDEDGDPCDREIDATAILAHVESLVARAEKAEKRASFYAESIEALRIQLGLGSHDPDASPAYWLGRLSAEIREVRAQLKAAEAALTEARKMIGHTEDLMREHPGMCCAACARDIAAAVVRAEKAEVFVAEYRERMDLHPGMCCGQCAGEIACAESERDAARAQLKAAEERLDLRNDQIGATVTACEIGAILDDTDPDCLAGLVNRTLAAARADAVRAFAEWCDENPEIRCEETAEDCLKIYLDKKEGPVND